MYLILTLSIAVYISFKLYNIYKLPNEWKDVPSLPFWSRLWRLFTKPSPIDVGFEKYSLPVMEKLGMATILGITKGWSLLVMDPECLKQIMKNTDVFEKEPFAEDGETLFKQFFGEHQVVGANGHDWKRMRKVINPIFNQSWDPNLFGHCFQQVIQEWDKLDGKNILIHDQIQRMTLDVMGKAFFDFDFEAVKNPDSELYRLYHDIFTGIFKGIWYLIFPIIDHIPFFKRYELHDKVDRYNQFVDNLVEKRKIEITNGTANKSNLLTQLIESNHSEESKEAILTDIELRDNLKIFFVAGHDTTANTLSATIYYLARHPEIQTKLRNEILEIVGESDQAIIPTVDQLKKMDYLNMIIKESMRCMTTAAVLSRCTSKPFTFANGIQMPQGKTVSLHMWGLFHNPKYFPNPNKFDPERFRDPNCEANKIWMPFLIGSRTCIGITFSLMEQRVALAMLLQTYTFECTQDNPDYDKLRLILFGIPRALNFHVDLVRRIPN